MSYKQIRKNRLDRLERLVSNPHGGVQLESFQVQKWFSFLLGVIQFPIFPLVNYYIILCGINSYEVKNSEFSFPTQNVFILHPFSNILPFSQLANANNPLVNCYHKSTNTAQLLQVLTSQLNKKGVPGTVWDTKMVGAGLKKQERQEIYPIIIFQGHYYYRILQQLIKSIYISDSRTSHDSN